jgi:DNA gyrase subunit A
LREDGDITWEGYERERRATGISTIIRFENGLERFFAGDYEALREACLTHTDRLNHRVVSVEPAGRADVYDLTVEGTHNFALAAGVFVHNSVDGYPPAAMRYTEARMTPLAMEMLADIEKDTVDFIPNYDDTKEEPTVLPGRFPNLLCNGSWGIAVAMTSKIPPHNLGEVVDGLLALIDDPDLDAADLMRWIKAPDFPTGGIIYGIEGVKEAYATGMGKITVRARVFIETSKGKEAIIVTEIPYMVSKATLLEGIAELVRDRKIDGITNIRDESDREGMRMVFELRRDARPNVVLNQLYKHTELQTTYGAIMVALVDGRPRVLALKQLLQCYIDHRHTVIVRRTRFELEKAQARAHILEGLRIALDHLDEIITLIRQSPTPDAARIALIERYVLSDVQAQAILSLTLQRLTGLERRRLEEEYLGLIKHISELEGILANRARRMGMMKEEFSALKEKYADVRRTEVALTSEEFRVEDLIADEDMVVTISHVGYIKRSPVSASRRQRRGGRGLTGMTTREEDFVEHLFIASTHAYILFLTDQGRCYWLKVYEIPQAGRASKGRPVVNLLDIGRDEKIAAIVPVREFDDHHYLLVATRQGLVKKTLLSEYANPRRAGITAINILDRDRLIEATITDGRQEIIIATRSGQAIRFPESEVRDMGRSAQGVRGITLEEGDEVVGMVVVGREGTLLSVTENGYGKRSMISDYRMTHRGGKGVISIKVNERNGEIISIKEVVDEDELMIISQKGLLIRLPIREIRVLGRNTQGVRLINLSEGDKVVDVARVAAREEEEEDGDEEVEEGEVLEGEVVEE